MPKEARAACLVQTIAEACMIDGSEPRYPAVTGARIRRIVIEQSKRANVGHIGSCLSVADMRRWRSTLRCD